MGCLDVNLIALFTDFGYHGPYVGQMKAALHAMAPATPVVDLMHDAPTFDPCAAGYLLAATTADFPAGSTIIAVVDPGVGTSRGALAVLADGRWYVGPDNGLLDPVCRLAGEVRGWTIQWRPDRLSASFHGRDLFSPVGARLALGVSPEQIGSIPAAHPRPEVPADWPQVIYVDHFGNAMTGIRASGVPETAAVAIGRHRLSHARTFAEVPEGNCFWYANSSGLVELAANRASAARQLGLHVGDAVTVTTAESRPAGRSHRES